MRSDDKYFPIAIRVAVSGGTGSAIKVVIGNCIGVGIKPPGGNPNATYDIEITDGDSMGTFGKTGLKGIVTVRDDFTLWAEHTVLITNASVDGEYIVKLWFA